MAVRAFAPGSQLPVNEGRTRKLPARPIGLLGCRNCEADIDRDRVANARSLHRRPSLRIGEQRLKDGGGELMTAAHRAKSGQQGQTGKCQVTDGIQQLVTHELLRMAQAFAVHDLILTNGDSVCKIGAERQTGFPEPLHIAHEAKRTSFTDFVAEYAGAHFTRKTLPANDLTCEIDLDVELKT